MPAPGALARRPGHLRCPSSCEALTAFGASNKLRQRHIQRRRQLDEIPIARISQPALDLADIGAMHPGKISQPLLGKAVDFATPRPYRFAKSL